MTTMDSKLMTAVSNGKLTKVVSLLKKGANVNYQCPRNGETLLIKSSYRDRTNITKLLLENGADVNIVTKSGYNALIRTCQCLLIGSYTDTIKLLLKYIDINQQNTWAGSMGNTALIEICEDTYGSMTGHTMDPKASNNNMQLLLDHPDIDISIKNYNGKTALMMAHDNGDIVKVKLIEQHIFKKKLLVQKKLILGKLYMSDLGSNLVEEALYEKISLLL